MTPLLFPDTTVLVNFALIRRMDLLELAAGDGRGRWCGTVAKECGASAQQPGLQDGPSCGSRGSPATRPDPS